MRFERRDAQQMPDGISQLLGPRATFNPTTTAWESSALFRRRARQTAFEFQAVDIASDVTSV